MKRAMIALELRILFLEHICLTLKTAVTVNVLEYFDFICPGVLVPFLLHWSFPSLDVWMFHTVSWVRVGHDGSADWAEKTSQRAESLCQGAVQDPFIHRFFSVKSENRICINLHPPECCFTLFCLSLTHTCLSMCHVQLIHLWPPPSLISYSILRTCFAALSLTRCSSCMIYCPTWLLSPLRSLFLTYLSALLMSRINKLPLLGHNSSMLRQ